jgi:hypothetical protein
VALYIGDGEIHESVTSGVREVPLEIYKGRQYWVAAYRHIGAITNPRSVQKARASARSLPFRRDRYNYPGAIKFGLRAFFTAPACAVTRSANGNEPRHPRRESGPPVGVSAPTFLGRSIGELAVES